MVSISVQTVAYRFALPIAFLLGAVLRPSFISAVYLLFALILPVLPALSPYYPTAFSTKVYLTSSMIISLLAAFGQATYQIYEISTSPDVDDYTRSCQSSWSIYWLRQLGFIRVKMDAKLDAVRVVLPEILTSFTSAVAFILCVILSSCGSGPSSSVSVHPGESVSSLVHRRSATTNSTFLFSSKRFSDVIVVLSLCFLGIVEACLLNAVYFIFFLFIITWWAAYIPLRRTAFSAIKAAIATYCLFHCFIIYLYQIQYFNEIIPDGSVVARVVGLFKFLSTDCNEWWSISIVPQRTANLLKSVLLLCVYFLLVVQYKWTRSCIRGTLAGERDNGSSIHEELLVASDDQLPSTVYGTERLMTASIERQRVDSSLEGLKGLPCALPDAVVTLISIFCIYCWIFVPVAMMQHSCTEKTC
ncbi:hypothetical protein AB6A40_009308 [Gnathostoma spinigerum]|uniref:Piezo TM1-24 domain-containing protein n=1 Tax=Gnathostoma spinigerum TaxID=75299 RepID=A0ABD6EWQ7_9BILA